MPKRDYIHCIACHSAMEEPMLKRALTELWYLDFGICDDCKNRMSAMDNPSIVIIIDGNTLKALLAAPDDQMMVASCFGEG